MYLKKQFYFYFYLGFTPFFAFTIYAPFYRCLSINVSVDTLGRKRTFKIDESLHSCYQFGCEYFSDRCLHNILISNNGNLNNISNQSLHRVQKQFAIRLHVQLCIVTAQLLWKENVVLSVFVSDILLFKKTKIKMSFIYVNI